MDGPASTQRQSCQTEGGTRLWPERLICLRKSWDSTSGAAVHRFDSISVLCHVMHGDLVTIEYNLASTCHILVFIGSHLHQAQKCRTAAVMLLELECSRRVAVITKEGSKGDNLPDMIIVRNSACTTAPSPYALRLCPSYCASVINDNTDCSTSYL